MLVWPMPPEWSEPVTERLAWLTDVLQAEATGTTQHRQLRLSPRRTFSFQVVAVESERAILDMLLARHGGTWMLPIWPDASWLEAELPAGSVSVSCSTAGRDFIVGGRALLHRSIDRWELVEVAAVGGNGIELTAPTQASFGPGDRVYPVRRAQLQDGASDEQLFAAASRFTLTFDIAEPSDWPQLQAPAIYRDHPVISMRPDESTNLTANHTRLESVVDYDTAQPLVHDVADVGLRTQQDQWVVYGRGEHTEFRSLLYTLAGRGRPMWVPSWAADLVPAGVVAANSRSLRVEWAGYSLYGLARPNRTDLRIELQDGTVLYRRISASVSAGALEILTLDEPLASTTVSAAQIRMISFLALCTLASDDIEIEHVTDADGLAKSTLSWQSVVPDGP